MNRLLTLAITVLGITALSACSSDDDLKLDNQMNCGQVTYNIMSAHQLYVGNGTPQDPQPNTFRLSFMDGKGREAYFGLVTSDKADKLPAGTYRMYKDGTGSCISGGFNGNQLQYSITEGTVNVKVSPDGEYSITADANADIGTELENTKIILSYNGPLEYKDGRPLYNQIRHKGIRYDIASVKHIHLGETGEEPKSVFRLVFDAGNQNASFDIRSNSVADKIPSGIYRMIRDVDSNVISGVFEDSGKKYTALEGAVEVDSDGGGNDYYIRIDINCTDGSLLEIIYYGTLDFDRASN